MTMAMAMAKVNGNSNCNCKNQFANQDKYHKFKNSIDVYLYCFSFIIKQNIN